MTQSSPSPQAHVAETTPNWDRMSRRRAPYYVAAAILLAILAGLATFAYLDEIRQQSVATAKALVASQAIASGEVVRAGAVEVRSMPLGMLPDDALTDGSQAIGRRAAVPIVAGEVMLSQKLISDGEGGISARLPDGRWAIVLPINWLLGPVPEIAVGDRLDVLGYQRGASQSDAGLVVSAVEVVVVHGETSNADRLTLAVSMEQATAILLARANGLSMLALLRPGGE